MDQAKYINSLLKVSPIPCDLIVGDVVSYKNDQEAIFENCKIVGFSDPSSNIWKGFIHITRNEGGAYWFPYKRDGFFK